MGWQNPNHFFTHTDVYFFLKFRNNLQKMAQICTVMKKFLTENLNLSFHDLLGSRV